MQRILILYIPLIIGDYDLFSLIYEFMCQMADKQ